MSTQVLNYVKTKPLSFIKLSVNICVFLGLMCFTLSLFLPAFFTSAKDIYGFWILAIGWMGIVFMQLAWFANPLNLLALLVSEKYPRTAFLLSFLAIALASCSLLFYEIPIGVNYEKVFIREFGVGFYFWFASHGLILFALFLRFVESIWKR